MPTTMARSQGTLLKSALLWGLLWVCFASQNAYPFCQTPTPVFENDIHVLSAHKMVAMLHNRYILVLTDANYIQVVDTEDPSLGKAFVQEIQLPGTPKDAAFDPDDPDGVYFLLKEGKVVKLNTARSHPLTWKIDAEVPFDGYGMAIAFKGGTTSFVAVATLRTDGLFIDRLNPDDLSSLGAAFPIISPGMITDMAITEGGIYVLLEKAAEILRLDAADGTVLASGDAGTSPYRMALDVVRNQILIVNPVIHAITVLDAGTLDSKTTLADKNLLPSPVAIAIAGNTAYIGGGEQNTLIMPVSLEQLVFSGELLSKSDELKDLYMHLETNTLYMSSPGGVYYAFDDTCLRVLVRQRQDLWATKTEILLSPGEVFGLRIEGGMRPFIHESAGLTCTPDAGDLEGRTFSCQVSGTTDYPVVIEDVSGHVRTIYARVAESLSVTPSAIDPVHVGGDPVTFTAIGGFSPVTWRSESGMLSGTSGRTVIYFPPDTAGYDLLRVTDRTGKSVDVPITVELSGLAITPAQALMFPGESRTFTAVGATSGELEWITTQGALDWIGKTAVLTAESVGDVELIVRNKKSESETGLAKIWVVQEALTISPQAVVLDREEGQLFRVSGGKGPYTWSSERGDLNAGQGDSVLLTAPNVSGRFAVRVSDKTGRVATADVTIEGAMYISPVQVVAKPDAEIRFSLINIIGTPSFLAESGYFLEKSPTHMIYKAPSRAGRFDLQVMDERSQTAFAQVLVTGPDLLVQPGADALVSGDAKLLTAAGGMGPFQWSADQGVLTAVQGKTVRWIAPDIDEPSRRIAITVTDSMGNMATCQMTVLQNETVAQEEMPALFTINPRKLTLSVLGRRILTLTGGKAPYRVTEFGDFLTADLTEDKVSVQTQSAAGSSYVEVMDADGNIVRSDINIYNDLTVSHTRLFLPVNQEEILTITGGLPPYMLIQSDEDGSFDQNRPQEDQVALKGVTQGRSNLIIRDQAGNTVTTSVSITSDQINVSPAAIDTTIGATAEIQVTGGSGGYTFQAQEGEIQQTGAGTFLYTVPDHTGSFTLTFYDRNERSVTLPVTVIDDYLSISPSRVLLFPEESTSLAIIKGRPPYAVTAEKGTYQLNGDRILFTAPAETGSFEVSVRDDGGNIASLTVQVPASIALTPSIYYAHPGDSVIFNVQGGTGDYQFVADSGVFNGIQNGRAIFNCPERVGHYQVTVADALDHKATGLVIVGDTPKGSPSYACLGRNARTTFKVVGGFPPYRTVADAGRVLSVGQAAYEYTSPGMVGVYAVSIYDARGNVSQITYDVVDQEVRITPEEILVAPGKGAFLEISGGKAPYRLVSSIGSLSLAGSGQYRFESPFVSTASGDYYIKAVDANGLKASARITIQATLNPPTTQETVILTTPEEIDGGKVRYALTSTSLLLTLQIPAYTSPVDIYLLLLLPSQEILFVSAEGQLTQAMNPYASSRSAALSSRIEALLTLLPGVYIGGWFIAPANGGDLLSSLAGAYELGAYVIDAP